MDRIAREAYEKGGFNGAWLYAEKGEIVSKGAYGWRDPESTLPIAEDTVFQLASVSKQFTAAAVMLVILLALLVERLSGVPYEEFLQKRLFEPAGMTATR